MNHNHAGMEWWLHFNDDGNTTIKIWNYSKVLKELTGTNDEYKFLSPGEISILLWVKYRSDDCYEVTHKEIL